MRPGTPEERKAANRKRERDYRRAWYHGLNPPPKTTLERFFAKIEPITESGCWIWIAALKGSEYGCFYANRRKISAHQFAYEHFVGPVPKGLQLDHLCRVRCCANPAHLEPVTQTVNVQRGAQFRRAQKQRVAPQ